MVLGDKFKGIIRTLRVLNWPKLEMHFKGEYIEGADCLRFFAQEQCDVCSPRYKGGHCFPNCKLNYAPSIASYDCGACLPQKYCMHCDDSGGSQYCTKCIDGSYRTNKGCEPCYYKCRMCRGLEEYDCVACFDGFEVVDGRCKELCGDGRNFGEIPCDDGNK